MVGSLYLGEKLGKNFFTQLFGPYGKDPRGPEGEGVQGTGVGA